MTPIEEIVKERRKVSYRDDVSLAYACGCSESRLEPPEYWEKMCSECSDFLSSLSKIDKLAREEERERLRKEIPLLRRYI